MHGAAQMLPMKLGRFPLIELSNITALEDTQLEVILRKSSKCYNHTPDTDIQKLSISLTKGTSDISLKFDHEVDHAGYYLSACRKMIKLRSVIVRIGIREFYRSSIKLIRQFPITVHKNQKVI
jgi:hypothetical protein